MPCNSRRLHEENQLRFSNSKRCRFYWTMLKTMRLGVLSWGHLRKNHQLRPAWESKSNCWSFRYVYCPTSQKASKVRKRLRLSVSKLATVLIWNIQSPHEDNLSPHGRVQNHNINHQKLWACSALIVLIAERERSIYDSCRFDIGRFRAEPTNSEDVHT